MNKSVVKSCFADSTNETHMIVMLTGAVAYQAVSARHALTTRNNDCYGTITGLII